MWNICVTALTGLSVTFWTCTLRCLVSWVSVLLAAIDCSYQMCVSHYSLSSSCLFLPNANYVNEFRRKACEILYYCKEYIARGLFFD